MKTIPWQRWLVVGLLSLSSAGGANAQSGDIAPFVAVTIAPDSTDIPKRYTAGSQLLVGVVATDTDGYVQSVNLKLLRIGTTEDEEGSGETTRDQVRTWTLESPPFVTAVQLPSYSGTSTYYELVATVVDDDGLPAEAVETIQVYNAGRPLPQVRFDSPSNGSLITFGRTVSVAFSVDSFEDDLSAIAIYENERQIALLDTKPFVYEYTPLRSGPTSLTALPYFSVRYEEGPASNRTYYNVYTSSLDSVAFSVLDFNPLTSDEDFVAQSFLDLAVRASSLADVAVWLPNLTSGSMSRGELLAALLDHVATEGTRGILAANLVVIGAWPSYAEFERQVALVAATADDGLVDLVESLLESSGYTARYGPAPTLEELAVYAEQEALAKQVYQNALGRVPSLVEIQAVANAPGSLTQAMGYNVAGSVAGFLADFVRKHSGALVARAQAASLRLGLLREAPSVTQTEADAERSLAELATELLASVDYTGRFLSLLESPQSLRVAEGSGALLHVRPSGGGDLTYQWYQDGRARVGATGPLLVLDDVTADDAGAFYAVIRGETGAVASESGIIEVVPEGQARLSNLSTRALIGAGTDALITGYAVYGSDDIEVLARVVGPTLEDLGISGAEADPNLVLVQGKTLVAANDNWGSATNVEEVRAATAAVGAFALREGSADAAVLTELTGDANYSVVGSGHSESAAVALNEVYDLGTTDSRLVNLSSRAPVGTGEQVLVGGFVIAGNVSRRVLIRAVGPGLLAYGVTQALANPQLEIFSGSTSLTSNDDWGATVDPDRVRQLSQQVGAFALTPGSLDAALVLSLDPGAYTVVVSGVGSTTGVALVEIYDLDP